MLTITIGLPPKALHPNARSRSHWPKTRALKAYRHEAMIEAMRCVGSMPPRWPHAATQATFYFKVNRNRDGDNALASLKAAFDGLADAGIVANDSGFTHMPPLLVVDPKRPRVEILIMQVPEP